MITAANVPNPRPTTAPDQAGKHQEEQDVTQIARITRDGYEHHKTDYFELSVGTYSDLGVALAQTLAMARSHNISLSP
jgi:hypothetical protein